MGIEGFERNLSAESKKALQSETWQKVRDSLKGKKEVQHFTAENTAENAYGWTWDQVVKEYLQNGYNAEDNSPDIVVMGKTYKTLRRPEVTVFYDAAGDTLFDVTNERLEKEYEWLMNGAAEAVENMDTKEENDADWKGDSIVEQTEEDSEAGEAPQTERAEEDEPGSEPNVTGENVESEQAPPEPVEIKATSKQGSRSAKQLAEEKLKRELEAAKDKSFADLIISYLLKRCKEDEGLAEDVVQEHKTWQKCFGYIYSQARKQAQGSCAAVRDDVIYEWAEDYYHKDDKAEEEKKTKKAAGARAKRENSAAEKKTAKAKGNTDKAEKVSARPKPEAPKAPPKPKKNGKEMDGQLDLFAMMGM